MSTPTPHNIDILVPIPARIAMRWCEAFPGKMESGEIAQIIDACRMTVPGAIAEAINSKALANAACPPDAEREKRIESAIGEHGTRAYLHGYYVTQKPGSDDSLRAGEARVAASNDLLRLMRSAIATPPDPAPPIPLDEARIAATLEKARTVVQDAAPASDDLRALREWAKGQRDAASRDMGDAMERSAKSIYNAEVHAYTRVMGQIDRLASSAPRAADAAERVHVHKVTQTGEHFCETQCENYKRRVDQRRIDNATIHELGTERDALRAELAAMTKERDDAISFLKERLIGLLGDSKAAPDVEAARAAGRREALEDLYTETARMFRDTLGIGWLRAEIDRMLAESPKPEARVASALPGFPFRDFDGIDSDSTHAIELLWDHVRAMGGTKP